MSHLWDQLIDLKEHIQFSLEFTGMKVNEPGMDRFNKGDWTNLVWSSKAYRRAHLDVVDARKEKGLWMMHVCVFPHLMNDAPIFGFDVVAGKEKMTGAFHDFSATTNPNHPMIRWFGEEAQKLNWKRERELPPWGKAIFTDHMIAAGNVRQTEEIDQVVATVRRTLAYYLLNINKYNGRTISRYSIEAQNRYAHYQKQNPHTPRVMKSLGLPEDDVDVFVQQCLFPEIKT